MLQHRTLIGDFGIPPALDALAVILFAITGALSAAKRNYDLIGTMCIALAVGCGGGLLRDILLNVRPVILERDSYLVAVALAVFIATYFCEMLARIQWAFLVFDALGLAMYAVIGTQKALGAGLQITAAALIGMLNAIGGGIIRDILTQEEVGLLKPGQWNAIIALGASLLFALSQRFTSIPAAAAGIVIVVGAVGARLLAVHYDIRTKPLRPIGFSATGRPTEQESPDHSDIPSSRTGARRTAMRRST